MRNNELVGQHAYADPKNNFFISGSTHVVELKKLSPETVYYYKYAQIPFRLYIAMLQELLGQQSLNDPLSHDDSLVRHATKEH